MLEPGVDRRRELDARQRVAFVQEHAQRVVPLDGEREGALEDARIDRPVETDITADDVDRRVRVDELPEPDFPLW